MTSKSVYKIDTGYLTYLVLACDIDTAMHTIYETEGRSEDDWRRSNPDLETCEVSHEHWDAILLKEDDLGTWNSLSSLVARAESYPEFLWLGGRL